MKKSDEAKDLAEEDFMTAVIPADDGDVNRSRPVRSSFTSAITKMSQIQDSQVSDIDFSLFEGSEPSVPVSRKRKQLSEMSKDERMKLEIEAIYKKCRVKVKDVAKVRELIIFGFFLKF